MSTALLDLSDSNLQLWHRDTHVQSPGYALYRDLYYLFSPPPRAAARLQPREINTRFWWQLSTEALQPALGPARHTGDLVHAHLRQLHQQANQPGEVLLAAPGSMQHQQLALLLGIVQQCPFDAVGLVNRSVALGSLYGGGERLFHLEIQLHQAVISELAERDNRVELRRTIPLPGCGLLQLQERLVELIAAEFVRQSRFDPRRKAATEQQLYDALPTALRALQASAETAMDINGYQARLAAHQLQGAGRRLFDSAIDAIGTLESGDRVIADPLAALLPGLHNTFRNLEVLAADDIRHALTLHQERLIQREQNLSFITALPCIEHRAATPAEAPPTAAPQPGAGQATHLLFRHIARPLVDEGMTLDAGWRLYRGEHGWQLGGDGAAVSVNGVAYRAGQALRTGDAIVIDGGEAAVLIEVRA